MPHVYSSKDAGLPAFYTDYTPSLQRFTNFKLIFKACLVDGYGSRPAAGWELIDEGDMFLVLRNAAGNYFTISSAYYVRTSALEYHGVFRVFLHATYTGMDANGVPQGQGVVSGTSGGVVQPVWFGNDMFYWTTHARWTLLADDRTFIFIMMPYYYLITDVSQIDTATGLGTLYVGDDLAGNHVAAGGEREALPTSTQITPYFDRLAFTTLKNPNSGLLVDTSPISAFLEGASGDWVNTTQSSGSTGLSQSTPAHISITSMDSLEMGQVRWVAAGVPQAGLRGIRREALLSRCYANLARRLLEGSLTTVNYTSATIHDLKPLSDGYCYLPLMANRYGRVALIVTDNEDFW